MTDDQIKHMVHRFLAWKLPEHFRPDCGIHFDADAAKKLHPSNHRYEPVGTNLLTYTQAEVMVRHMIDGIPAPVDTHRMVETGTGSVRSMGSAVAESEAPNG